MEWAEAVSCHRSEVLLCSQRPASTVSFSPTALVTATSVDSRGFPLADRARYRLSRSTPAALATLAIPPRASAILRRAIRSTRGSSSSSNAARRYSAANSGFPRSSRTIASSCGTLALRFMTFSPNSPASTLWPFEYPPVDSSYCRRIKAICTRGQSLRSRLDIQAPSRFATRTGRRQVICNHQNSWLRVGQFSPQSWLAFGHPSNGSTIHQTYPCHFLWHNAGSIKGVVKNIFLPTPEARIFS